MLKPIKQKINNKLDCLFYDDLNVMTLKGLGKEIRLSEDNLIEELRCSGFVFTIQSYVKIKDFVSIYSQA